MKKEKSTAAWKKKRKSTSRLRDYIGELKRVKEKKDNEAG